MINLEKEIMGIIASAGESKAKAFQALKKAKSKEFDAARALLKESRELDLEAHKIQTKLISAEMSDDISERPELSLLMVHAQDHYMSAQLARDLIETLIFVFDKGEE